VSPSFSRCIPLITPVVVIQGFTMCNLVGKNTCCHSDLSHVGVVDAYATEEYSSSRRHCNNAHNYPHFYIIVQDKLKSHIISLIVHF
jgi:hypothetical protein